MSIRKLLYFLVMGCALAALSVFLGSLLNPSALARWESQTREHDAARAMLAMIGIRHLPIFLFCIVFGYGVFAASKNTTWEAVWVLSTPYILYVFLVAITESLGMGESAFSWIAYEPSYFIWPHFVFVPAGVIAASRMAHRHMHTNR